MRVLLGEDNDANADLFRDALERDGHSIVDERDGLRVYERALDEIRRDPPGYRDARAAGRRGLRAASGGGCANAHRGDQLVGDARQAQRGLAAGSDTYLTKPIAPRDLRDVVREVTRQA